MAITNLELGHRLRRAREASGLTQAAAAQYLGASGDTIMQIELGTRTISGLELSKFSYLYARDMREFTAPDSADDDLRVLFRSEDDSGGYEAKQVLRDWMAISRELSNLENLLRIGVSELEGKHESRRLANTLTPARMDQPHAAEFNVRFLALALEALRRDLISQAKFVELMAHVGVTRDEADTCVRSLRFGSQELHTVLLPESS